MGLRNGICWFLFSGTAEQTANGAAISYAAQLDSVSVGDIIMHNVSAGISPGFKGNEILLGMSFLKHIEFTQRGNTLILRQSY